MDHFSILYMPCINFEIIQFQFNLISLEHQSSLLFLKKVGSDGKKHRGFKIDVVIQKRCHNSKDKKILQIRNTPPIKIDPVESI